MPGKLKVVMNRRDDVDSLAMSSSACRASGDDRRACRLMIEETIANLFFTRWLISSSKERSHAGRRLPFRAPDAALQR